LFAGLVAAAIARQKELRFPIDESALRRRVDEQTADSAV
jgi:CTP synthase